MTLPNSGTIVAADVNSELEGGRANLEADAQEAWVRALDSLIVFGLTSATAVDSRSRIFQVDDVCRVDALRLEVDGHASATIITTATVEAIDANEDADTSQMEFRTPAMSITTSAATKTVGGAEFVSATGDLYWLRPGIDYRFSVSSNHASATTRVVAHLVTGCKRSRR